MPKPGKGYTITEKGYCRITSGPDRNKYQHRVVTAKLAKEWCYWPLGKGGLPDGFVVHHMDFDKQHNCHGNLLLIQREIHDELGWAWWDVLYRENQKEPDWVTEDGDEQGDWEENEYEAYVE